MSVSDQVNVPSLPDRQRAFRWGYYAVRVVLVAVLLVLSAGLPGRNRVQERFRYREGDISRERIVAPYDFRVLKDEAALRREQATAAAAVPPVFVVDDRVSSETLNRFASFQERAMALVMDPALSPAERARGLRSLGVPLSEESALSLAAPGRACLLYTSPSPRDS